CCDVRSTDLQTGITRRLVRAGLAKTNFDANLNNLAAIAADGDRIAVSLRFGYLVVIVGGKAKLLEATGRQNAERGLAHWDDDGMLMGADSPLVSPVDSLAWHKGDLYLANAQGIFRFAPQDGKLEELASGQRVDRRHALDGDDVYQVTGMVPSPHGVWLAVAGGVARDSLWHFGVDDGFRKIWSGYLSETPLFAHGHSVVCNTRVGLLKVDGDELNELLSGESTLRIADILRGFGQSEAGAIYMIESRDRIVGAVGERAVYLAPAGSKALRRLPLPEGMDPRDWMPRLILNLPDRGPLVVCLDGALWEAKASALPAQR
ncbi:MAG: hypothetical protein ACI8W8_005112, partial [Rhodothermales bacterium]